MSSIVYLDVCCLKRPFDDQRATRVQLETAAVAALIERAEREEIRFVRSPAHTFENDRNPREDRRLATASWLNGARVEVALTESATARARELGRLGFAPLDALHIAFAEEAGADSLATTDDVLLALGQRHREKLHVSITNPTHLLQKLAGGGR